ncbi:hypothetical protein RR46_03379 [Papilio xuthus]|uniref:Uncharacterized protein n=1 Tax=Papilio xuthus TaxID=66420 RepID=A0A194Q9M1_PAPXU|nr:hypothetical protein RR46_03379 [Papilio xuthus]
MRLTGGVDLTAEVEQAGDEQSGSAVGRATPLSHLTGAVPRLSLRLRQTPRHSAPHAPTLPRGVRAS